MRQENDSEQIFCLIITIGVAIAVAFSVFTFVTVEDFINAEQPPPAYTAVDIWNLKRDAVVQLRVIYEFNPTLYDIFQCSGSFITPDGYIITQGHCVQNRLEGQGIDGAPRVVDSIFVAVENANGEGGFTKSYSARIVGVDGSADIAVIYIDMNMAYNANNTVLENQNYLEFGSSRDYPTGSVVYAIGSSEAQDKSIKVGTVAGNRHQDTALSDTTDTVYIDMTEAPGDSGSPLLDSNGDIIATLSWGFTEDGGSNFGKSQKLIQPIVEQLIEADRTMRASGAIPGEGNGDISSFVLPDHVEINTNQPVQHLRYQKGWLGISSFNLLNEASYLFTLDNVTCQFIIGKATSSVAVYNFQIVYPIGSDTTRVSACTCGNSLIHKYLPQDGCFSTIDLTFTNLAANQSNSLVWAIFQDTGVQTYTYYDPYQSEAEFICDPTGTYSENKCMANATNNFNTFDTLVASATAHISNTSVHTQIGQWLGDTLNYYFVFTLSSSTQTQGSLGIKINVTFTNQVYSDSKIGDFPTDKNIYGFIVSDIAGGSTCRNGSSLPGTSPLINEISLGDVVVALDDIPIGNGPGLFPMSDILWNKLRGDEIKISTLTSESNRQNWKNFTAIVDAFPYSMDVVFNDAFSFRTGYHFDKSISDDPFPFSSAATLYQKELDAVSNDPFASSPKLIALQKLNEKLTSVAATAMKETGFNLFN